MKPSELKQFEISKQCNCGGCKLMCKTKPGALAPGDYERISEFKNVKPNEHQGFLNTFFETDSDGPLALDKQSGEVHHAAVIRPKKIGTKCVFLGKNDRCKIHPVRPFECSHSTGCLGTDYELIALAMEGLGRAVHACVSYTRLWRQLWKLEQQK